MLEYLTHPWLELTHIPAQAMAENTRKTNNWGLGLC
jgi:hypothetical protein